MLMFMLMLMLMSKCEPALTLNSECSCLISCFLSVSSNLHIE